jgi:tetratricopeptide (TPR) repeat protein
MKTRYLLAAAVLAVLLVGLACEPENENVKSQAEWVSEGWARWQVGEYDDANLAFGNALKRDPYYAPAFSGVGWTLIREHDPEGAAGRLEDGRLLAESGSLHVRQEMYYGLASAYNAGGDFMTSADRGRYMADHLPENGFKLPVTNARLNYYDLYLLLAVDYYGLGDSANTVWAINKMRGKNQEPTNFVFTTWAAAAAEIDRLSGEDPGP